MTAQLNSSPAPRRPRWTALAVLAMSTAFIAAPTPGDMCNLQPQQQCDYGNTTCVCLQGQYFCN